MGSNLVSVVLQFLTPLVVERLGASAGPHVAPEEPGQTRACADQIKQGDRARASSARGSLANG
jgi:hypothetical protein